MSHYTLEDREFPETRIYKHTLREFFTELRDNAHHIYALLNGVPKSVFWIFRERNDTDIEQEIYSIPEFYAHLSMFLRRKDTFDVYFNAYFFRDEWDEYCEDWVQAEYEFTGKEKYECSRKADLSVAVLEKEFPRMLAYWCRESILANKPFELTRQTIKEFGFTRKDVAVLREPIARCNERVIAELRAQYNALAAIDCLHKAVPGRRSAPNKK
mgnify:CR=1 FL=1